MKTTRWHRFPDPETLAQTVVTQILAVSREVLAAREHFSIVLAGGTTPEKVYRLLAQADTAWSRWSVYFGDERCLPVGDSGRNSVMAACSWLNHVAIPPENIHIIPAERGAEAAARAYAVTVAAALPFDLVLLGMGEDGHTASLFPGQQHDPAERVHAVHEAPKPPPDRVSLSATALNDSHRVMILVTGAGKRAAVQAWRAGEALPIAAIHGHEGCDVYLDAGATPA